MNWKQFLTEKVLKGCWHDIEDHGPFKSKCCKCGMSFGAIHTSDWNPQGFNRTFDNRSDLMDLYEAINRDGKIWQFEKACWEKLKTEFPLKTMEDILNLVTPWMFCLDGKGYEERCKHVAEFYGWNEQRDPVIDKNSGAYGDN